ncbi:MAG: diaminopimelate epimerase [Pseudomonadota bacterium]
MAPETWTFWKMHGLGNDFVVVDARAGEVPLPPALVTALADRHRGIGFDQLAVIGAADGGADAHLTFYNADGSTSGACGNATRCIGHHLMAENGTAQVTLTTEFGTLAAVARPDGLTAVNMGHPRTAWAEIPLGRDVDTDALPLPGAPVATSMGNPHCTFFVEDADAIDLNDYAHVETDALFPERTNVQVAARLSDDAFRVRVWERGVGRTLASGSSACAVACAAIRTGRAEARKVRLQMEGGWLEVEWREDGMWMAGETAHVFTGVLTAEFLERLG